MPDITRDRRLRSPYVTPARFKEPLRSTEFSFPYGWSNDKAPPIAIACQILLRGANVHDVIVASRRWGWALLREAASQIDTASSWRSSEARRLAIEVIDSVEAVLPGTPERNAQAV